MGRQSRIFLAGLFVFASFVGFWTFVFRDKVFGPPPAFEASVGTMMSDAQLTSVELRSESLSELIRGKKTVLSLWATWCDPCIKELPLIQAALPRLEAQDTQVLLINYDEGIPEKIVPEAQAWLVARQADRLRTFFDFKQEVMNALSVQALPFTVGIGADSKIQWIRVGELDWSERSVKVN